MATKDQVIEEMQDVLNGMCSNFIALVCTEPNCDVAIVIPRYPSTDNPKATSIHQPCDKHDNGGDGYEPYYFDRDGNEVTGDPYTWSEGAKP